MPSQDSYKMATLQQRCAYIRLETAGVKRMLISDKLKKVNLAQKIVLAMRNLTSIFILNNHRVRNIVAIAGKFQYSRYTDYEKFAFQTYKKNHFPSRWLNID